MKSRTALNISYFSKYMIHIFRTFWFIWLGLQLLGVATYWGRTQNNYQVDLLTSLIGPFLFYIIFVTVGGVVAILLCFIFSPEVRALYKTAAEAPDYENLLRLLITKTMPA